MQSPGIPTLRPRVHGPAAIKAACQKEPPGSGLAVHAQAADAFRTRIALFSSASFPALTGSPSIRAKAALRSARNTPRMKPTTVAPTVIKRRLGDDF